jgi:YbbR domain-containing protein
MDTEGQPVYAPLRLSQTQVDLSAMLCHVREVPLRVEVLGEVAPLLEVASIEVPRAIYVRGSEDALARVKTLTAAAVDISGVDVTTRLPLSIYLPEGVELASASAGVNVPISIKGIATKDFAFTPNEILAEGLAEGFEAYVNNGGATVTIFGAEDVVSGFTKEDIALFVDLSEADLGVGAVYMPLQARYEKELRKVEITPETAYLSVYESAPIPGEGSGGEGEGEDTSSESAIF